MQENTNVPVQQSFPGERQWLRSALLEDHDGILTTTRLRLARLARARGVEPHLIDDVVQETLLEAWSHLERLQSPAGFHLWIDEICRNICRRAARRKATELSRQVPLLQPSTTEEENSIEEENLFVADIFDPLEDLMRQDFLVLLDRALGALQPDTRQLVELCYLRELPRSEVAMRLGISSSTLDVRLHRARRQLRQVLHGPLQQEAEALGVPLDEALAAGWQPTRLWCPLCARQRLEALFLNREAPEGPNLHLRCPDCYRRYKQDTVHSMGLVRLSGIHSFRPAWKRTMQGLTDRIMQALLAGQHPCLNCGKPARIQVKGSEDEAAQSPGPYPFWIHLHCVHCGKDLDGCGHMPSVDQLVYWSHPLTRQFLQQHPRWSSEPGKLVEYERQSAIHFHIAALENADHLTVLAHPRTLQILTLF